MISTRDYLLMLLGAFAMIGAIGVGLIVTALWDWYNGR